MIKTVKHTGFTLAEVLITLGIIGVVAAMTIPTLIANTRSQQYRSSYKKAMSTLSQASRMAQARYGFDYAGITKQCGKNGGSENPETDMTICAMLNGTLTGATYFDNLTDLKLIKKNKQEAYSIKSPYLKSLFGESNKYHVYTLSDGVIIGIWHGLGNTPCELPIGVGMNDTFPSATEKIMADCAGFIDVNGVHLPNKEVSCSSGSNSLKLNNCVVKNDAKHLTDIYPIRFHDGIVEPATASAKYVLQTAK